MDRHKIWRLVRSNYNSLKQAAPDGHVPVVEVFLVGRAEPMRLGEVHTTREPGFPWTLLVAETEPHDETASPDERLVFVPEHSVERVEIRFERSDAPPVGFVLRTLDEPPAETPD